MHLATMLVINALACDIGPMLQGSRIIKTSSFTHNSQALHHGSKYSKFVHL